VFPYLVFMEFLAALLISILLLVWALAVDAPLLPRGQPRQDRESREVRVVLRRPAELLVYFDPWIAGVAIPTLIILRSWRFLSRHQPHATGRYTSTERRLEIGHFLFGSRSGGC